MHDWTNVPSEYRAPRTREGYARDLERQADEYLRAHGVDVVKGYVAVDTGPAPTLVVSAADDYVDMEATLPFAGSPKGYRKQYFGQRILSAGQPSAETTVSRWSWVVTDTGEVTRERVVLDVIGGRTISKRGKVGEGRPPKHGTAMTAAERKREERARKREDRLRRERAALPGTPA